MKKFNFLKTLSIAFLLILSTAVSLNAVMNEHLPNRPEWRGFFYCLDMADYQNFLLSNMPYKILQGYIIADSIVRAAPGTRYVLDTIHNFNVHSDTAEYLNKYWYLINEYDPLRFYAFLHKKYPEAKNTPLSLHGYMRNAMSLNPKSTYVTPNYILHVYINDTVLIDTSDIYNANCTSKTIAFCKVLDTLKGSSFPSLNNAIFWNEELSKAKSSMSFTVTTTKGDTIYGKLQDDKNAIAGKENIYAVPQRTDVVFSYRDWWDNGNGRPLINRRTGEHWIKPKREYIVFLECLGMDAVDNSWKPNGSVYKIYYQLSPYPLPGSYSMYPIENGNVIDETNSLGFGKIVPVAEFKQNIRNRINEIKNYGE